MKLLYEWKGLSVNHPKCLQVKCWETNWVLCLQEFWPIFQTDQTEDRLVKVWEKWPQIPEEMKSCEKYLKNTHLHGEVINFSFTVPWRQVLCSSIWRIIIFSTRVNIRRLLRSMNWYVDGTFETSPNIPFQVFIMLGSVIQSSRHCGNEGDGSIFIRYYGVERHAYRRSF